jgi:hypothetical protein
MDLVKQCGRIRIDGTAVEGFNNSGLRRRVSRGSAAVAILCRDGKLIACPTERPLDSQYYCIPGDLKQEEE